MYNRHRKPWPKSKRSNISKQSPSPLHHTFFLGRARFTTKPLSALPISVKRRPRTIVFTMQMRTWQQQSHCFLTLKTIVRSLHSFHCPKTIWLMQWGSVPLLYQGFVPFSLGAHLLKFRMNSFARYTCHVVAATPKKCFYFFKLKNNYRNPLLSHRWLIYFKHV